MIDCFSTAQEIMSSNTIAFLALINMNGYNRYKCMEQHCTDMKNITFSQPQPTTDACH